ncbi:uncharacterized protein ARMOST_18303 [Armillaria ostoyae]|uniref:Uncharacterized protein n=1 Tax=Armillaria ostoyae TaxID=47428 RepID=A0A284S1E0_ARMOS|nr:uncharacterized protein ARMOST_18303 [Armillaria ostoyae]
MNEPPSHRHDEYRKVFFNCGLIDFLFVQPDDIPLLPFQLLLQRRSVLSSHTKKATLGWAKPKHTLSKPRNERPTMSVPPISPSRDTSSHTVPRPSLYNYDVASQRRRTVIIDKFQAMVERAGDVQEKAEEDEEKSCRISYAEAI